MENKFEYQNAVEVQKPKQKDSPFVSAAGFVLSVGMIVLRVVGKGLKVTTRMLLNTNKSPRRIIAKSLPLSDTVYPGQTSPAAGSLTDADGRSAGPGANL